MYFYNIFFNVKKLIYLLPLFCIVLVDGSHGGTRGGAAVLGILAESHTTFHTFTKKNMIDSWFIHSQFNHNSRFSHIFSAYQLHGYD